MAYYLSRYKGKYKLMVEYNPKTSDFYKTNSGLNLDTDVFIDCKFGRIYHYGGNVLTAYVEPCDNSYVTNETEEYYLGTYGSKQQSHQECYRRPSDNYMFDPNDEEVGGKYDKRKYNEDGSEYAYKTITKLKTFKNKYNRILKDNADIILDTYKLSSDCGGSFQFKSKDIDRIAEAMGCRKSGVKNSPFSVKYLPKDSYTIPKKDLERMKVATSKFDKGDMLKVTTAYKMVAKNHDITYSTITKDYRLSAKQVFHKLGLFDELIECIENL